MKCLSSFSSIPQKCDTKKYKLCETVSIYLPEPINTLLKRWDANWYLQVVGITLGLTVASFSLHGWVFSRRRGARWGTSLWRWMVNKSFGNKGNSTPRLCKFIQFQNINWKHILNAILWIFYAVSYKKMLQCQMIVFHFPIKYYLCSDLQVFGHLQAAWTFLFGWSPEKEPMNATQTLAQSGAPRWSKLNAETDKPFIYTHDCFGKPKAPLCSLKRELLKQHLSVSDWTWMKAFHMHMYVYQWWVKTKKVCNMS